jgi:hypothetical protein
MSFKRRLGRLQAKRRQPPCGECGYPEDPSSEAAIYELEFADPLEDLEESDEKWCPACGRQLTYDIWFPDTEWQSQARNPPEIGY